MITIELLGEARVVARLNEMPSALRTVLRRKIYAIVLKLQARIQRKLSGEVLNVRTGALRRSIQSDVAENGETIVGRVFSTGDVKYARIHEYGGQTRAHVIEPRKAKMLAFAAGGKTIFAGRVKHPGSRIPERSYMRSSLTEMRDEIIRELSSGLVEAST